MKRFVSIWFRSLSTDWFSLRQPELHRQPFVLRAPSHGRMVVTAANALARAQGIDAGMVLADARAMVPGLLVRDDRPDLLERLLRRLAEWCIRFTPVVAPDPPDGLLMDVSGCAHLWGGDKLYLQAIVNKLRARGYDARAAMADTPGVAWGMARFGREELVVAPAQHHAALMALPPEALRLDTETLVRLRKLGLRTVGSFVAMPRGILRRRFGNAMVMRLHQALGVEAEEVVPVVPPTPYHERLPCLEPVTTAGGIAFALQKLLEALCVRLHREQKGLRTAVFRCYCVDGRVEQAEVGTHRPTHSVRHLNKLFELKLAAIEPGLGIELFALEALRVEDQPPVQEGMWQGAGGLEDERLSELIDRLSGKIGFDAIRRYVPAEHHWPERSFTRAASVAQQVAVPWREDALRPIHLLHEPERIEVSAPIPDYPPMLFRYKGKVHNIVKADGPERIEQEWWLREGQHRDYYRVEDEEGRRYWVFRLGHYHEKIYHWFIHGFFA